MVNDKDSAPQDPDGEATTALPTLHAERRTAPLTTRDRSALPPSRAKKLSCPFCGAQESSPTNLWRHKAQCAANSNPTCPYCSWHYKPAELERHMKRCDYRDTPRADAKLTALPTKTVPRVDEMAFHRAPATREDSAPESAEGDDGGTGISPSSDARAEPRGKRPHQSKAARRRALLSKPAKAPPHPPAFLPLDPVLASLALNAEELTRGLLPQSPRKLASPREARPVVTLAPATPRREGGLVGAARSFTESGALVDLAAGLQ